MTTSAAAAGAPGRRQMLFTLISCMGSYCVANATWWMQPVLMDQLVTKSGLSASAAGLVLTAEMGAMAVTASSLAKLLKGGRFLTLGAFGLVLTVAGSFLSLIAPSYLALVLARLVAGGGEGCAFLVANTAIICFPNRDRAFASMALVSVFFGVALVSLAPMISATGAAPGGFVALLVATCLLAPAVLLMPPAIKLAVDGTAREPDAKRDGMNADIRLRIALLATTAFMIGLASGVIWSFYGLIGQRTGLPVSEVNSAIATSIFTAVVGSSLAAMLGKSVGRLVPVSIAVVLLTAAIVGLSLHPDPWTFRVGTCVNVATLYFIMPYLFAAGSIQDASGRGAAYVGSAFLMTGALSPYLGGILLDTVGIEYVAAAVVLTSFIALVLFAYVERHSVLQPTPPLA